MCADANDAADEHVRSLLVFFGAVMSLETQEDRLKAYQQAWARLNPAAEEEVWDLSMPVNFPWSTGKIDLWSLC